MALALRQFAVALVRTGPIHPPRLSLSKFVALALRQLLHSFKWVQFVHSNLSNIPAGIEATYSISGEGAVHVTAGVGATFSFTAGVKYSITGAGSSCVTTVCSVSSSRTEMTIFCKTARLVQHQMFSEDLEHCSSKGSGNACSKFH